MAILLFSAAEQARAIKLSKTKLVMAPGDYVLLEATVLPENAEDKTVEWFTSNPDAVVLGSMWSGSLTAQNYGTSVITCVAVGSTGVVEASCVVQVVIRNKTIGAWLRKRQLRLRGNRGSIQGETQIISLKNKKKLGGFVKKM